MKAWCDKCGNYVDYTKEISRTEEMEIKGTRFHVTQSYGICPLCGEEVLSTTMTDSNIQSAHSAYRRALDSITAEEIRTLLDRYKIGAQPLSLLLGWGANTIERQMKHTIPDREHASKLRSLNDPRNMLSLLQDGKDRITRIAYERTLKAVQSCLPSSSSTSFVDGELSRSAQSIFQLFGLLTLGNRKAVYQEEYTSRTRSDADPVYRYAFNH